MTKRYLTIPAVVAGLSFGAVSAFATEPQPQQPATDSMQQKLEQLQAEIQQLKAAQAQQQQQQQAVTSKQVDDTVTRVLNDADKRSKLLQLEGFTAGWNNGRFMVGSANGDFTLMPFLLMQVRNTTSWDTSGGDNVENGFSLPNVYLGFDGKAFGDIDYQFLWNSGDSGGLNLEQAWGKWHYSDQMAVRAGQFIDPVFKEQLVGAGGQLAVDRSMLNLIVTGAGQSFTQGVTFCYTADQWNFEAGFTDGINTGNTNFRDFPTGPTNFGFAGRVEYFVNGKASDYQDFTAYGHKDALFVIGAGADWTQSGDTNDLLHTVDVMWKNEAGLSLYGAYVGQWINNGAGAGITGVTGGTDDSYNWGFLLQAGYAFNNNWEVFGRLDNSNLSDPIATRNGQTEDNFWEITGGVNYYIHGQNAKITIDASWLPQGAPAGLDGLGILNSDDNTFVIRAQFQLML